MVSVPVVPKLNPNHVGIGSRTERLRVLKRRKLKNSLRFYFLLFVLYPFLIITIFVLIILMLSTENMKNQIPKE